MSSIFTKVVLIDGNTFCFCDKEFSKTCSVREANNLDCKESIIRVTPIVRDDVDELSCSLKLLGDSFNKLDSGFSKTLKHLDRIVKK